MIWTFDCQRQQAMPEEAILIREMPGLPRQNSFRNKAERFCPLDVHRQGMIRNNTPDSFRL